MAAVVFDFDGVIADSAREVFVVALRTHVHLAPASELRRVVGELESRLGEGDAAIEAEPLYRSFMELMPLGNRAEDFGVALAAISLGVALPNQDAYDGFLRTLDQGWLRAFHDRFYEEREAFKVTRRELWFALQPPYAEVVAMIRRQAGTAAMAIATAKDRASVQALLARYGIGDVFPEGAIADKDTGASKVTHLERLCAWLRVVPAEIVFLDDKVNHLERVASLGVRCALAAWGYNGARERAVARARGFLICSLDDAEARLFSATANGRADGLA